MTEQFRLDEVARDRRHVDGDEGAISPLAIVVQCTGNEFLAGAGLAGDHQREVGLHQPRKHAVDFLHGGGTADQRHPVLRIVLEFGGPSLRFGERPADDADQLRQIERLRQIIVSALLRSLDGRHEGILSAHHENRQIRPCLLDPWQEIEGVFIRHHDIGHDQVAVAGCYPAPEGCGIGGDAHIVSGTAERLVQHGANGCVVIRDEDRCARHPLVPFVIGVSSSAASPLDAGMRTRKVVRLCWLSHSTMPPWPPMILATSARPRPDPFVLVVMNGSKRCGSRSGGTPGPLSCTQNSRGSEIFSRVPATERRMPGR